MISTNDYISKQDLDVFAFLWRVGIFQTRICVNIVNTNEILYLKSRM